MGNQKSLHTVPEAGKSKLKADFMSDSGPFLSLSMASSHCAWSGEGARQLSGFLPL